MLEQKSVRLMSACAEGNLELVTRIASKFKSTDELCETEPLSGYSALMMAARHGHAEVVDALVALGHDRTEISRDPNNNNILMVAAEYGHQAVFEIYVAKFPRSVNMCNKNGWSPLTAAARYGAPAMVEILLNLGADLNHRDEEGSTPLHHAAAFGHLQTISLLIERGSSASMKNNSGWTALDFAFSAQVAAHMEAAASAATGVENGGILPLPLSASPPPMLQNRSSSTTSTTNSNGSSPTPKPAPLSQTGRKESWTSLQHGPLSPILASISGATSPRLAPSNAWSEFKRVVQQRLMMATKTAAYTSDEEDHHHDSTKFEAVHNYNQNSRHAYSDDEDSDEVVSQVQHIQVKQGISARRESRDSHHSRYSQPSSPVSSRGGRGGYSFEDHHHGAAVANGTAVSAAVDHHSPVLTHAIHASSALPEIQQSQSESRNSWEENDSEEEPYPADAYDYGHESEEEEDEDDYEERPRSHLQQKQQQQKVSLPHADHPSHTHESEPEEEDDYTNDYGHDYKRQSHASSQSHHSHHQHQHVDEHNEQHNHRGYEHDGQLEQENDHHRYSFDSVDKRSSVQETPNHYNHQDIQDRQASRRSSQRVSYRQEQDHHDSDVNEPEDFYDNFSDEEPVSKAPPSTTNTINHNRESVQSAKSAKSYTSNSKHHSFGYENDHHTSAKMTTAAYAHEDASESESASSESEAEKDTFVDMPMSPPPPPIPTRSRPTSNFSLAGVSTPGSPTLNRGLQSPVFQRTEDSAHTTVAQTPISPVVVPAPVPTTLAAAAPLMVDTVSQKSGSSASSIEQRPKRYSGSDSDTSGTSIDLHSPTPSNPLKSKTPGNVFSRTLSNNNSSTSRENSHRPTSAERQRPISYATVFSDADLNDISLMDEPLTEKRASVVVPRTPVTPSTGGFGFASSFFGRSNSISTPPQTQQIPPVQTPPPVTAAVVPQSPSPAPVTPAMSSPAPTPASTVRSARSGSISALANSIQGAFSRGFSSSSAPPVPPLPSRTPSQIGQQAFDPRFSTNSNNFKGHNSDRASTISNQTNDSNMDLLLARLEAQNELLEQEHSKRRFTNESDMDRALGHAKEESAGENIDWDYWGALMHDYNAVVKKNPKQLTAMIQKGVPSALRGQIWQLIAKSKDPMLEATYAELLKGTSTHEKQITRDLSRTFPNHEYFQAEGLGQESLFNVVKAYSLYDPEVGYCQGLSFVVGPLLLNMPEEEAFCMLVRMMSTYEMRGHYTPEMNALQLHLYQFEQLMEETVPIVFKHLRNQGIRSTMYASQWFMTLFAYKFPLDLVYRVYDIILVEGVEALLRFAIALLKANHDKILSLDFEVLIEFLKNGIFEPYMNDYGLFIQDAYNVKVTPKKLTQYAQKYQAMVQKQQAELAAEESLRETNKNLSSQVRTLEASLHQLNKEHVDLAKELITRKMDMAQLQDENDVLSQKVTDLTKIVDSQAKEVEEQYKNEIQDVLRKNMEYLKRNEQLEDQMAYLENLVIETKMKYAESENERDALTRKLSDMRKALGVV
ncbi:GTPase-activating protein [Gryganskiella cystojenkinii]|nr:GTPase-activating protein [Gryganskiella cystojenkinii]